MPSGGSRKSRGSGGGSQAPAAQPALSAPAGADASKAAAPPAAQAEPDLATLAAAKAKEEAKAAAEAEMAAAKKKEEELKALAEQKAKNRDVLLSGLYVPSGQPSHALPVGHRLY